MFGSNKISRRNVLKMGLGATAGLALWDLYQTSFSSEAGRGLASVVAFKDIGIDEARLARLIEIALQSGGQYADVFLEYSISNYMSFTGDRLQNAGFDVVNGAAIRVIAGSRTVLRVTESLSWEGLVEAARAAASDIRAGAATAKLPALKRLEVPSLYPVASPPTLEPIQAKIGLVVRMAEAAQKADPAIQSVQSNYKDALRFITVATSNGVVAYDSQPFLQTRLSVMAARPEAGRTGLGSYSAGGRYGLEYFNTNPPENIGRRAAEMARHQMEGVEPPGGELPIVLGPGYGGVLLHEAVGHMMEADFNVKGYSVYSDRLGQMIASPLCTVIDDGRRPNLNGSINFDDEGTPSASNLLVEGGRLVGYMHSRETAAKLGVAATGNGRRQSFSFPPQPRMTNTYLQGEDSTPEEIIRSVKFGIYAKSFDSGTADVTTGNFTFVPLEAYLIESGRITTPIANVSLIGNGPDMLKRVSMVGNDMQICDDLWLCGKAGQMIPVTVGTPTFKVDKVAVGGALQGGRGASK